MKKSTGSGRTFIVSVAVALLVCTWASADTFPACAERVYAQDVAAKRDYQRGVRELIMNAKPDLATLATLEMDQQLALLERRQIQFAHLVRTGATRIRTREGLSRFVNFEWRESDTLALRQQNPNYAALERKAADLERQKTGRSDWPALQEYSRSVLAGSPQFQHVLQRLQAREASLEGPLEACQPSR